ncbi:MAG: hypothetical protein AAF485_05070 [Chloroflexota bacterium]
MLKLYTRPKDTRHAAKQINSVGYYAFGPYGYITLYTDQKQQGTQLIGQPRDLIAQLKQLIAQMEATNEKTIAQRTTQK